MEITNAIGRGGVYRPGAVTPRASRIYLFIIFISAVVFFIPNLGKVHLFDWDEINFAESAREMIVTGNYHQVQINFQPFWEKPPLFFWLQVLSMKAFGINEFAARLPNAIFGIITLLTLFFIGRKHRDERFGFIWAMCYLGSFLPHLYFKSGIIDPVFNYFIFLGVYCMYIAITNPKRKAFANVALSGIFIGLSDLTKGPVGLLVFLLTFLVYFIFTRFKNFPNFKKILLFIFCFTAVSLLWFGQEVITNGFSFLKEFLTYQANLFLKPVASHGEPFYYHFVVVFLGCFPISVIALPALFSSLERSDYKRLMKILFWTVMILFSITTTKIVHYSSLTYFPLSFIAATYISYLIERNKKIAGYVFWILAITGLVFSLLLIGLPIVASNKELLMPYLKDPFAAASLDVAVHWNGYEFIIGVVYFAAVMFSLVILKRRKIFNGFMLLFFSTAFCLFFYMLAVVPKIEAYSQGTAIKFYESLEGQDVYVSPVGFKSYAQYFYFKKPGSVKPGEEEEMSYLLQGPINKPAYFLVKITNKQFDTLCRNCTLIKKEGGYFFYRREAIVK